MRAFSSKGIPALKHTDLLNFIILYSLMLLNLVQFNVMFLGLIQKKSYVISLIKKNLLEEAI